MNRTIKKINKTLWLLTILVSIIFIAFLCVTSIDIAVHNEDGFGGNEIKYTFKSTHRVVDWMWVQYEELVNTSSYFIVTVAATVGPDWLTTSLWTASVSVRRASRLKPSFNPTEPSLAAKTQLQFNNTVASG